MAPPCPSPDDVRAYRDGGLPADSRARIEAHLPGCAGCRALAAPAPSTMVSSPSLDGVVVDHQRMALAHPELPMPERYRVIEVVGSGGMGTVYAAHDETLDRPVALKVLRRATGHSAPEMSARLQREARIMARLSHPNVLPVFDLGAVGEHVFVAMELVDGWTCRQWLARTRRSWREILAVYVAAGEGLAAAHQAGLIHRDFKADNVLIGRDGRVRVSDFGLAKSPGDASSPPSGDGTPAPDDNLTRTGSLVGTPRYMSPEQLRGERLDARSDVFSYCASLYESLRGVPPFEGDTTDARLRTISAGVPQPSPRGGASAPRWLLRRIQRGLRAEPADRYPSMPALLAALRTGQRRAARWRRALIAAPIALVLAGGAALALSRDGTPALAPATGARPSFAILPPENRAGDDLGWLSAAFGELLGGELAQGDQLRRVDADLVARTLRGGVALPGLRRAVDADLAVVTSYARAGDQLRLDVRLEDLRAARTIAVITELGAPADPWTVARRASARVRQALDLPAITSAEAAEAARALPRNPEAAHRYATALALVRAYQPDRARPLLEQAIALEPDHALAHAALAQVWRQLGQVAKAAAESERAFERSDGLPRAQRLRIEASHHVDAHRWPAAIDIYRALLTFFPDDIDDGILLARAQVGGGQMREALATLDRMRQLPPPLGADPRLDLAEALAAARLHEFARSLAAAERAAAAARARGARLLEADAEEKIAQALRFMGRFDDSLARYRTAASTYAAAGHDLAQASMDKARAEVLLEMGRTGEGALLLAAVLPTYAARGDDYHVAGIQNLLGQIATNDGDVARATEAYDAALGLYRRVADEEGVANVTSNRADLQLAAGQLDDAGRGYTEARAAYEHLGIRAYEAGARANLAMVMWRAGELIAALSAIEPAIADLRATDDKVSLMEALFARAAMLRDRGDAGARAVYDEAVGLQVDMGGDAYLALARTRRAELLADQGTADEAELRRDLATLRAAGMPVDAAALARILARVLIARGAFDDAAALLAAPPPALVPEQLAHAIALAELAVASGDAAPTLAATCRDTAARGLVAQALDCRLVLARSLPPAARRRAMTALAADARRAGFERIARACR